MCNSRKGAANFQHRTLNFQHTAGQGSAFEVPVVRFQATSNDLQLIRSNWTSRLGLYIRECTMNMRAEKQYDLEKRLLDYSVSVIRMVEHLPATRAGNHVASQLLRSGTSALPNHGEAQSAESKEDFVHKMSLCLKELRESSRWLQLMKRVPLVQSASQTDSLIQETEELIRIFVTSIRTARNGKKTR